MDIAPTVVHMMGRAVPSESDGKVLLDIFDADSGVRQRDIIKQNIDISRKASSTYLSSEEQSKIERQLHDLGYLG